MSAPEVVDLLARARRNLLSSEEQAQLEGALEKVPESRLLLRAGLEFDAEASAAAGDEELIARIARKVERRRLGSGSIGARDEKQELPCPSKPARRFAPLLVAALYLVIGAAAGVAGAATYLGLPAATPKAPAAIHGRREKTPAPKARVEPKALVEPKARVEPMAPSVGSRSPSLMPAASLSPRVLPAHSAPSVVPASPSPLATNPTGGVDGNAGTGSTGSTVSPPTAPVPTVTTPAGP